VIATKSTIDMIGSTFSNLISSNDQYLIDISVSSLWIIEESTFEYLMMPLGRVIESELDIKESNVWESHIAADKAMLQL